LKLAFLVHKLMGEVMSGRLRVGVATVLIVVVGGLAGFLVFLLRQGLVGPDLERFLPWNAAPENPLRHTCVR
jgi:membrane-associated phospholipid phosphatase